MPTSTRQALASRLLLDAGAVATQAAAFATEIRSGSVDNTTETDVLNELVTLLEGYGEHPLIPLLKARAWLSSGQETVLVLIGGTSGTGKSTVSEEVARRLGIPRVVDTDVIREVMRSVINPELLPPLFKSTFGAAEKMRTNVDEKQTIRAFEQQVAVVQQGVVAAMRRIRKEQISAVFNGVHIVGGLADLTEFDDLTHLYHYVLTIGQAEDHQARFEARQKESGRGGSRYKDNLANIRLLDEYIRKSSEGTVVVANEDFQTAVNTIVDDVVARSEASWADFAQ
jgi:2-phosphoglycerate kinase